MADNSSTRITFSCPTSLRDKLTEQSDKEGIARSQLIVEILENAIGTENSVESRNPAVNRLIFDIQKRLSTIESWRREIQEWTQSSSINSSNLETTLAELLNTQLGDETEKATKSKKKKIPVPRR